MTDLTPGKYFLSGRGDLGIDPEIRPYLRKEVEVLKKCKSGLYFIKTNDGKLFSVPKSNLETAEQIKERLNRPPPDFSDWTIEETVELEAQIGLDLEQELVNILAEDCRRG